MMRSLTSDGVLLSLIAVLLPLHLFLTLRFRQLHSDRRLGSLRSVIVLASIPVLILAIFVRSDPKTSPPTADGIISQMEEVKHKISQLESILEENTKALNSKTITVKENNERIKEMEHKIQYLQNTLCKFKASPSETTYSEERIVAMEEEVRFLWEESRKNNFNIHVLESKASDLEGKLMDVAAEVEKMESIITEQWIQIRQLEQSLHMTKTMMQKRSTSKVQDKGQPKKWILQKFIESIRHCNLPDLVALPDSLFLGSSRTNSWISQVNFHLRTVLSLAKKRHHEVHKWSYSARNPLAEEGETQMVLPISTHEDPRTDHVEDIDDSNEVNILRKKLKAQDKELKKAAVTKLNLERRIDRLQSEKSTLESGILNLRKEMEEDKSSYILDIGKLKALVEEQETIEQLRAQLNKPSPPHSIPDYQPVDTPLSEIQEHDSPQEEAARPPADDNDYNSTDESTESDNFVIAKSQQSPEQKDKSKGKAPATLNSFINRIKTRKRKPHVIPDCVDLPMKKKKIMSPKKVHRTKPPSKRYSGNKNVVYKHLRESDKKMLDLLPEQYEEGCVWGNTPRLCMFMEDLSQLIGNKSISNLVINAFANILQRRMDATREKDKDSYFFDCFAFPAAKAKNATSMQLHIFGRMNESSDYRYNYFPINSSISKDSTEGYHWTLLKVDTQEGLWTLYNSLHGNRKRQQQYRADALLMKKTFEDYMNEILPLVSPSVQTRLVLDDKCPQQPDTLDCGPFICYYMQELSAGRPLPSKLPRDAIKRFRAEMASCILNDPGYTRQLMPTNSGLL